MAAWLQHKKEAFDDLLVEFGLDQDPAKIEKFLAAGDEIQTLNIGNFDEFRQAVNAIERTDQTGAIKVLTGPVKRALDEEGDILEDTLQKAGVTDEGVLAPLREARKVVTELKTDFNPQNITGKLIDSKSKSNVRRVEASQVFKEVFGGSKPVENVREVVNVLKKSGDQGAEAIRDLQASYVLDLLDSGFKASGRKIDGTSTVSPAAVAKRFQQLGKDKFDVLFESSPVTKRQLEQNLKALADSQPQNAAVPKGSGSVILDLAKSTGVTPFLNKAPRRAVSWKRCNCSRKKAKTPTRLKKRWLRNLKFEKRRSSSSGTSRLGGRGGNKRDLNRRRRRRKHTIGL